ncbi:MAG: S8 family peptidase [Vicinamibacterales bacterium]
MNSTCVRSLLQARVVCAGRRSFSIEAVASILTAIAIVTLCLPITAGAADRYRKLDPGLNQRASAPRGRTSQVVVRLEKGQVLPTRLQRYVRGSRLQLIDSYILDVPDSELSQLDALPQVASAHEDRPAWAADYLSTHATGADSVQQTLSLTGRGIGVAVIDSGITSWHDDLTGATGRVSPYGNQRVAKFVDFVNGQVMPYDDHGHGSHVAGIILGNGYDSRGRQSGMAPEASLISLKVLDAQGKGTISRIIQALDWVDANATRYNIRVVNLSVGAAVTQSYWLDPLALAARRLTERGIVVVAAAGNLGQNAEGQMQYRRHPRARQRTVGPHRWRVEHGSTARVQDDTVASFSSVGPTRGDYLAKPDLVAPGRGIISLTSPGSTLYQDNRSYLVDGTLKTGYSPYLSLSGTSMAAPQVAGAVALMLQANPNLTPNLVKGICSTPRGAIRTTGRCSRARASSTSTVP